MSQVRKIFFEKKNQFKIFKLNFRLLDNVKALYRRAKGNVGAWNTDDAKKDFQKCLELDSSLTKSINRDLEQLDQDIKLSEVESKLRYKKMFS